MNFDMMLQQYDPNFDNEAMIEAAKETGNKELKDKVINNNIRIAVKLANKWKKTGYKDDLDDLVSLGLYGLIVAFDTYDSTKKIKFVSYAGRVVWMEFVKAERYKHMKCRGSFQAVSIETPIGKSGDGSDKTIADILSNEEFSRFSQIEEDEFNDQLIGLMDTKLNEKERVVAQKYFFDGMGISDIGKEINQTRQTTHFQYKNVLKKLAPVFA
ncbi:sigma-70 family RNA polymerase sigma factor [Paenibacillus sp. FSL L8-0435]|uniref:sigma-70 family RNA polymerase sigma factor n=1 Tax=Paenibacillus sp. FSL L8-0435 TaxID=2954618 RepID=UPI0030D6D582